MPRSAEGIGVPVFETRLVAGAEWDRLVADFDGVCQEQLVTYARMRWPGVTLEPLLFLERGEPVGGALMMIQNLPMGLASIALCKWGPFLRDSYRGDPAMRTAQMVETIIAEYADKRAMMVSLMPKVEPGESNQTAAHLLARGFTTGASVQYPMRYVVDVRLDDDARLAAFAQKWRYNLRKSFKAGLEFEVAGPKDLSRFMDLYQAMSERKLFPDYSAVDTLPVLMAMDRSEGRPDIFLVHHDGKPVAGAVIFSSGDTACYLYGASDDAALDLRAGYFMHWHIIRWLRDNTRVTTYDLGGTDGFSGLHQFKSGMVGAAGYINPLPPTLNYATKLRPRLVGNFAYYARGRMNRLRTVVLAARLDLMRKIKSRTTG